MTRSHLVLDQGKSLAPSAPPLPALAAHPAALLMMIELATFATRLDLLLGERELEKRLVEVFLALTHASHPEAHVLVPHVELRAEIGLFLLVITTL